MSKPFRTLYFVLALTLPSFGHAEPGRRTLYCFGVRGAAIYSRLQAWCGDVGRRQFYRLKMQGAGAALLSSTGFKLIVTFPADRYDRNFDVVPGEYFASTKGFSPGYSQMNASAGNKTLVAHAINVGAGLDYTMAAHLRIKPVTLKELLTLQNLLP